MRLLCSIGSCCAVRVHQGTLSLTPPLQIHAHSPLKCDIGHPPFLWQWCAFGQAMLARDSQSSTESATVMALSLQILYHISFVNWIAIFCAVVYCIFAQYCSRSEAILQLPTACTTRQCWIACILTELDGVLKMAIAEARRIPPMSFTYLVLSYLSNALMLICL